MTRGWYATVDKDGVYSVWHPKDSPNNPDDRAIDTCSCTDLEEAIEILREEGWLSDETPKLSEMLG